MTSSANDIRYGRRGGRLTKWSDHTDTSPCEVCGRPMVLGQTRRHFVCSPPCKHDQPIDLCNRCT